MDYKSEFRRFLSARPEVLHFAAHSHHYWPDVTFAAHQQAWLDAAERADDKWGMILDEVLGDLRCHLAEVLDLPDPQTLAFAPNTHELLTRLVSCLDGRRLVTVLTTDAEFHSFARQCARWEEAGLIAVERVPVEPFDTFGPRFLRAARRHRDLVYVSQVFFNSGFVFEEFSALIDAVPSGETLIVVDGYHGFFARPTSLRAVADRVFYLAGGYKYAMAGEGACFMHSPAGYGLRPINTGWFAGPGPDATPGGTVRYGAGGDRFFGGTFDASGLYRLRASLKRWRELGVDVPRIHAHVVGLQQRFLRAVQRAEAGPLQTTDLVPDASHEQRGHFLTFRRSDAGRIQARLRQAGVATDVRGDRLRVGFALYHDEIDVDALLQRLRGLS
ncbi:MAG: aminotransferase [Myxococcales bacterium FL481]|nr:MAG: aminotransferase [Myxococcales bacterium FL481]